MGGAALVVACCVNRMPSDIDAAFAPNDEIHRAAEIVGDDLRLPRGWLNDLVKVLLPVLIPAPPGGWRSRARGSPPPHQSLCWG